MARPTDRMPDSGGNQRVTTTRRTEMRYALPEYRHVSSSHTLSSRMSFSARGRGPARLSLAHFLYIVSRRVPVICFQSLIRLAACQIPREEVGHGLYPEPDEHAHSNDYKTGEKGSPRQ